MLQSVGRCENSKEPTAQSELSHGYSDLLQSMGNVRVNLQVQTCDSEWLKSRFTSSAEDSWSFSVVSSCIYRRRFTLCFQVQMLTCANVHENEWICVNARLPVIYWGQCAAQLSPRLKLNKLMAFGLTVRCSSKKRSKRRSKRVKFGVTPGRLLKRQIIMRGREGQRRWRWRTGWWVEVELREEEVGVKRRG